ncbi:hypothetical protein N7535_002659 [Penicillium sp. DV-2018c]|nr:hypothetical protein N7461_001656 [Penicillium sp. DV-2018c]KAJ5575733.1 hypothetical protein N7535_002659 [Penicillium sp. DV-2018c]
MEARSLVKRSWSSSPKDWKRRYTSSRSHADFEYESTNAIPIKRNISELVWYQTARDCGVEGEDWAFAAYVAGGIDAKMYIGFSMVAEYYDELYVS